MGDERIISIDAIRKNRCNTKDQTKDMKKVKVFCPQQCKKQCVTNSPTTSPTEFRGKCENLEGYKFENKKKKTCQKFVGKDRKQCNNKDKKNGDKKVKVFCPLQCDKRCATNSPTASPSDSPTNALSNSPS